MSASKQKNGILRMINYSNKATPDRFKKSCDYVTGSSKTSAELMLTHLMDANDTLGSLSALERRWGNDKLTGRLFKHGIISFGCPDLEITKAKELLRETLNYYEAFPWLAALHTDTPRRLHAHFLLLMRNVITGEKFSQSHAELMQFRQHYHHLALKYGLLGLRDFSNDVDSVSDNPILALDNPPFNGEDEHECWFDNYPSIKMEDSYKTPYIVAPDWKPILDKATSDFKTLFEIGFMKGFGKNGLY